MYKEYFRLNEMPFSIAPDPRFLFMSDRHREALAHLLYGVQGEGGIVLLTGEVGTGKTTLCRSLLEQIPDHIDVAFILNPRMSVEELLQTVCEEFHIDVTPERPGTKAFVDAIHARLLQANARGRRAILLIDEAQNLDPLVLEQLRLLTNLETNTRKLLQIILIGQPELQEMLARPEMRQVAQRVIARYHLSQLSQNEAGAYVAHRLRISGAAPSLFPDALMRPLHRATGGVPRLINLVCDRALLGTYVQGRQQVTPPTLKQAVKEVVTTPTPRRRLGWAAVAAILAVAGLGVGLRFADRLDPDLAGRLPDWLVPTRAAAEATPIPAAAAPVPAATAAAEAAPTTPSAPAAAAAAAAPGAPAATVAAVGETLDWPVSIARQDSERLAFEALLGVHGIKATVPAGADPCRVAADAGLRCFATRGGLSDLLLIDQPVVMRLAAPDGDYAVTLVGLSARRATLLVAGERREVPLSQLAGTWSGRYTAVWKAPPGFGDSLSLNQRGAPVAWLRRALARIDGVADDGSVVYDEALARRVRAFQLGEGILPDGLVGPLTAIRLAARLGEAGPRLAAVDRKG